VYILVNKVVYINDSQGSVATYARCGVDFNNRFTANLPENQPVKES